MFTFSRMEWSSKHDIFLCTEILITEPFKFRKGSLDRGRLWTVVANNLNRIEEVHFNVKQRGVREVGSDTIQVAGANA